MKFHNNHLSTRICIQIFDWLKLLSCIVFCKKISFSCERPIYKANFNLILIHIWLSLHEECFGEHFGECIGERNGGIPTGSL